MQSTLLIDEVMPTPELSDTDDDHLELDDDDGLPEPPEEEEEEEEEDEASKLPSYFPAIEGCRNVDEFLCLNRIEEGTYGVVYRAKDKKTSKYVRIYVVVYRAKSEG